MAKKTVKTKYFEAYLMLDGMQVAFVSAPTKEQCEREINHYAMMYGQDGPCEIHFKLERKKK